MHRAFVNRPTIQASLSMLLDSLLKRRIKARNFMLIETINPELIVHGLQRDGPAYALSTEMCQDKVKLHLQQT